MTSPRNRHPLKISLTRVEPLGDIVRRVWNQSAEDNVLFLAGGLAFNILLALVPFVLLLISGLSFLLGSEIAQAYELRRGELALRQHKEAPTHEVPGVALPDRAASTPAGTTQADEDGAPIAKPPGKRVVSTPRK